MSEQGRSMLRLTLVHTLGTLLRRLSMLHPHSHPESIERQIVTVDDYENITMTLRQSSLKWPHGPD
jgi:hypothetical protein